MAAASHNLVVSKTLKEMRDRWSHDTEAGVEWNYWTQRVRQAPTELEGSVGEIFGGDSTLEKISWSADRDLL